MGLSARNKWLSLSLLAIILPIGTLITLKIGHVLIEPQQPEIIAVSPVTWNMTRPGPASDDPVINEFVQNSYSDGKSSIDLIVNVIRYYISDPGFPAYGNDNLKLGINATVELSEGLIYSILAKFYSKDQYLFAVINDDPISYRLNACQVEYMHDLLADDLKAYVAFSSLGNRRVCSFSICANLIFLDEDVTDHFSTISLEIIYFNGVSYNQVEVPVIIGVTKN